MERGSSNATLLQREKQKSRASSPWRHGPAVSVTLRGTTSKPLLSGSERRVLPTLPATHTHASADVRTRVEADAPRISSSMSPVSTPEHPASPWTVGQPAPYETSVYIPVTTGPVASEPVHRYRALHHQKPPLTPPDSMSEESEEDRDNGARVVAIPGTMSSRGSAPRSSKSRTRSSGRQDTGTPVRGKHSRSLSKRVKTAFHDIFQRNPVDESAFESIDRPHWTDD